MSDVVFKRYHAEDWQSLKTNLVGETTDYYRFKAESYGLSYFVITVKGGLKPDIFTDSNIRIVDFVVSPTEGKQPLVVNLQAIYKNTGIKSGQKNILFKLNGKQVKSKTIKLDPNQTEKVEHSLLLNETGGHELSVSGLRESVKVKATGSIVDRNLPWILISAVLVLLVIGALVLVTSSSDDGKMYDLDKITNDDNETEENRKHVCPECGDSFDPEKGLQIHIGEVHPEKEDDLIGGD